jgi:hypothetical protein
MLSIRIPSTFEISNECAGRSVPSKDTDGQYVFAASDEEYMFWCGLTAVEKDELITQIRSGCFSDVLLSAMKKMRPGNYAADI